MCDGVAMVAVASAGRRACAAVIHEDQVAHGAEGRYVGVVMD